MNPEFWTIPRMALLGAAAMIAYEALTKADWNIGAPELFGEFIAYAVVGAIVGAVIGRFLPSRNSN
jgi:hypothetical protein